MHRWRCCHAALDKCLNCGFLSDRGRMSHEWNAGCGDRLARVATQIPPWPIASHLPSHLSRLFLGCIEILYGCPELICPSRWRSRWIADDLFAHSQAAVSRIGSDIWAKGPRILTCPRIESHFWPELAGLPPLSRIPREGRETATNDPD
jgi:hypothetical protein